MAVYVDRLMHHGWRLRGRLVKSCHLMADSEEELHNFARRIGLRRSWAHQGSVLHYDLTSRRRADAIRAGAKEIDHGEDYLALLKRLKKPCPTKGATKGPTDR
jgi:hypothetical protein